MFEKLSKRLVVDVDKVVFNKDQKEKAKLGRALNKETLKERTRLIQEKACEVCDDTGYIAQDDET